MMNIAQISKISLFTFVASLSSLAITSSASALTWNLSGTFDDLGELSGSFDFDGTNFTNVNITTDSGSTLGGTSYIDDGFGNANEVSFTDTTSFIDLNLFFDSSLSSGASIISLGTGSNEEDFNSFDVRNLQAGGTVTPVPFEPSANLGILTLLGIWGLNRYRKKLQD